MTTLIRDDRTADLRAKMDAKSAEMKREGTHILQGGGNYPPRECASISMPGDMLREVLEVLRKAGYGVKVKGGYWRVGR